ncbi:HNH endonuclease [Streptomyces longwoodensis]
MGYKLATQTGVGLGKTVEAGLIVAAIVAGRLSPVDYLTVLDGQHRTLWLGRQREADHLVGAARAELSLRPQPFYRELRGRVEEREAGGRHEQRADIAGSRRARDRGAREAVLLRSEGRCENPWCLLPALPYRTAAGGSLLEVDHIDDHARGGRDHPSAMIALCPNCHANKTRGAGRAALRERLRPVARELDAAQDSDAARDRRAMPPRSKAVLEQCAALLASLDDADRDQALASLTDRFR